MNTMNDYDKLRFIQRVLEGNPPQSDKAAAAQMARDLRRDWHAKGNPRQAAALSLMRDDPKRDLYEGAGPGGKSGSGEYWVMYSAGAALQPLTQDDVNDLAARGLIEPRRPGCYRLAPPKEQ